ncbi:MAG: hypothetical protein VX304_09485 [Planctomycetota bacterium]|nr:hypothetical protein [Planctomycetota bacterium]
MTFSRRDFLTSTIAGATTAGLAGWPTPLHAAENKRRLKIAAITTIYFKYSHAQHIVDRFLEGYSWEGRHHRPDMDVASLYVEQVGENDLSRERLKRFPGMKHAETIEQALTLGTGSLAVDGVLLIGEHGNFPVNEKGQTLYPRYEYFKQIVDVYRKSGRTAPIFNDKHLSWNWKWAREMYDTAQKMDFGFMAGSSMAVGRRMPAVDLPWKAKIRESLVMRPAWLDGGDIHTLEALQAIIERRNKGESGIQWVEALTGDRFWKAMEAGSWDKGGWDKQLMATAFTRSNMIQVVRDNYGVVLPTIADLKRMAPESYAYRFQYNDGTRATALAFQESAGQGRILNDTPVAVRMKNNDIFSTLVYLPYYTMRNFFNPLVNHMETLFSTGKSPYPIERTLLTTGMTAAGVESLFQKQKRLATPHLAIKYKATERSTFWRT